MLIILMLISKHFPYSCGILGGYKIYIEEAPYTVNYGDICGGVLIHQKWVVTTAHCGTEDYIRIGDKHRLGGPKLKIRQHIVHPKFGKKHSFDYDVQLLLLHRSLSMNKIVTPIKISDGTYGDYIYIAGWGYNKEKGEYQNDLHQVKLKIVPFKKCQNIDQKWFNHTLTTRMFCAGGDKRHDACQGDSGGAAVSNGQLIGIASFGFGCGRDIPGVYANVSETGTRSWIQNYTGV